MGFTEPLYNHIEDGLLYNKIKLFRKNTVKMNIAIGDKPVELLLSNYLRMKELFKENQKSSIKEIIISSSNKVSFRFIPRESTLFPAHLKEFIYVRTALIIEINDTSMENIQHGLRSLIETQGQQKMTAMALYFLFQNINFQDKSKKIKGLKDKNIQLKDHKLISEYYIYWWKVLFDIMYEFILES
nr:hypothetical protein [Oedogonium sp. 210]